jgi:nucleotide-binding universal stress UspA family protein
MTVVAAVDRSDRARSVIEAAHRLAGDADMDLHVVHVGAVGVPSPAGGYDPDRDRKLTEERAVGIARDLTGDVGIAEFEPVGREGDPATELLAYSREVGAAYVVVSTRERSPIGQAVFGSVTQTLLLEADCPVVAVPHDSV